MYDIFECLLSGRIDITLLNSGTMLFFPLNSHLDGYLGDINTVLLDGHVHVSPLVLQRPTEVWIEAEMLHFCCITCAEVMLLLVLCGPYA